MDQINLRAKYEAQYSRARSNLLMMTILTAVNILLLIAEADLSFLFAAILPQLAVFYGWLGTGLTYSQTYTYIGYGAALLIIGAFLLCYFMSKKRKGWMTAALVLFCIDCLALVYWIYLGFMIEDLLDIAFHICILIYLIRGVRAGVKKEKYAPLHAAAPVQPEAPVMPVVPVQPEAPVVPEAPVQPEAPVAPEASVQPEMPIVPEQPEVLVTAEQPAQLERTANFGPQEKMGPTSME